jgi:hypothetical protein
MQPLQAAASQSMRRRNGRCYQNNLKKIAAIIFFAALFTAQYARYGGYLGCRFANWVADYSGPSSAPCDCDKWVASVSTSGEHPSVPFHHQHYHLDELFIVMGNSSVDSAFYIPACFPHVIALLEEGIYSSMDRPPAA